jgi:single-stranded-DNA-specific exonuclease
VKWKKKDIAPGLIKDLSSRYGCDLLTASVLSRRGITKGDDIKYFLEDDKRHLRNPFELSGMEDAVDRILAAKEEGEKILVFGDRDVDGITGTVLLTSYLQSSGLDVVWRIPTGDEPYGLSVKAVEEFAAAYGTLIITVDNGISCLAEIRRANELSVDVIITDHHNPQEELPEAYAIINPKLKQSPYPFRDLSGCAVAYKLTNALRFAQKSETYGQSICLLNTRPVNDAWIIEAAKLRNLALMDTLTETVVPGMVSISGTRLPAFLEGQQILVWDAPLQRRTIAKLFGAGVEVGMLDISGEIGKEIPSTAGKGLLRIKELSRIAKYSGKEASELEVFTNLFVSFVQKRENLFTAEDAADLQLAALGTIADIMPLKDENRIIARHGIQSLMKNPRPGISDLLFKLGLAGRHFETRDISWTLCPAINAAGRMGSPEKAAALLFENDPRTRDLLAGEIIKMNDERKKLGEDIWVFAEPMAEKNLEAFSGRLAAAWGPEIFRGVTGIMAQRLARRFRVPGLAVSFGESVLTGSFRSFRGYDLHFLLERCADLFIDWGGHDFAAGFSMPRNNWDVFISRLKSAAVTIELNDDDDEETAWIDAELPHEYLCPDIFKLVDRFEPYGEENDPLTFLARRLKVQDLNFMGKTEAKHVKLTLDAGKHKWPAVYWQAAEKVQRDFDLGDTVDIVFTLARNYYKGAEIPQIMITDLKRSE